MRLQAGWSGGLGTRLQAGWSGGLGTRLQAGWSGGLAGNETTGRVEWRPSWERDYWQGGVEAWE